MNRNESLNKLGNAIREYRGRYEAKTGKWIYKPRPSAGTRVLKWMNELGLAQDLAFVDQFKSFDEFNAWLKTL